MSANKLEKIRVYIWMIVNGPKLWMKFAITRRKYKLCCGVINSIDTVKYIAEHKCSVCRFGDGEFQMINHLLSGANAKSFNVDTFQGYNEILARGLLRVLSSNNDKILICVPYPFMNPTVYKGYASFFFMREWINNAKMLSSSVRCNMLGDSTFTRFYLNRKDIKSYVDYLGQLQSIWSGRKLLIVEGEFSRLGVGNDLFDSAVDIKRIICPAKDAFTHYDGILKEVKNYCHDRLVIIALGHTATVLAFDLAMDGHQAIDIGHIDIEYEWLRMGAREKVPVKNKYVNEVSDGRINVAEMDMVYNSQVIARVLS